MNLKVIVALLVLSVLYVSAAEVDLLILDTKDKPISGIEVAFRPVTHGIIGELMKPGKTNKEGKIQLQIGPLQEETEAILFFDNKYDKIEDGIQIHCKSGNNIVKVEKSSKGYKLLTKN